jgi:hypothetical protein
MYIYILCPHEGTQEPELVAQKFLRFEILYRN